MLGFKTNRSVSLKMNSISLNSMMVFLLKLQLLTRLSSDFPSCSATGAASASPEARTERIAKVFIFKIDQTTRCEWDALNYRGFA